MRIDAPSNIGAHAAQTPAAPPVKLEQGDVVVAQVLQVKDDQVQLRLESGEVIKATMLNGVPLSKGDVATLMVMNGGEAQLTMQVMGVSDKASTHLSQDARMLLRMGFEASPENLQLIHYFNALKMPVRPELFERAIALKQTMPKLEPALTVFFAANQIDVDEQVLSAMRALLAGARTGEELGKLAEAVDEALGQLIPKDSAQAMTSAEANSLEALLTQAEEAAQVKDNAQAPDVRKAEAGAAQAAQPRAEAEETVRQVVRSLASSDPQAAKELGGEEGLARIITRLIDAPQLREAVVREGVYTIMDKFAQLDPAVKILLTAKLEALYASPDTQSALPGEAEARTALRAVLNKIADVFVPLAAGTESRAFKMDVESLPAKLAAMQNEMQQSVSGKHAIMRQANEVIVQNRLHSDISSCVYMQIPLQINDQQRTAELYVMRRKDGNRRIDPEHATILVALETEQMGRVETLIKIEGKGVALQFRMENEQAINMFRDETADMHVRLQKAGYRLTDMRCMALETPVTPVNFSAMTDETPPGMRHRVDITA